MSKKKAPMQVEEPLKKTHKAGILSNSEKEYITTHLDVMTIDEICENLNRGRLPVLNFIKNNTLETPEVKMSDEEKQRTKLRKYLMKKYYFANIKAQLLVDDESDEVELFINKWIDMMIQFKEDVLALEEAQMNELIYLSINMERVRKQEINNIRKINRLEKEIEREYNVPQVNRDLMELARMETEIMMARTASTSYITQIKNINSDINKLHQDLKSTRNQRFTKVESDSKTFTNLVRKLQDDKIRGEVEREVELMRLATNKERDKLYDYHTYGDGMVDCPIFNHESAKKVRETKTPQNSREKMKNE